jgi:hypothetical protein
MISDLKLVEETAAIDVFAVHDSLLRSHVRITWQELYKSTPTMLIK